MPFLLRRGFQNLHLDTQCHIANIVQSKNDSTITQLFIGRFDQRTPIVKQSLRLLAVQSTNLVVMSRRNRPEYW